MEIGKKLKKHEYSLDWHKKMLQKKSMYQGRPFQIGKTKFPKQKDIKEEPVFTCLQNTDV